MCAVVGRFVSLVTNMYINLCHEPPPCWARPSSRCHGRFCVKLAGKSGCPSSPLWTRWRDISFGEATSRNMILSGNIPGTTAAGLHCNEELGLEWRRPFPFQGPRPHWPWLRDSGTPSADLTEGCVGVLCFLGLGILHCKLIFNTRQEVL